MLRKCVICGSEFELVLKLRGQATRKTCSPECHEKLKHINKLKGNKAYRDRNKDSLNAQSRDYREKNLETQRRRVRKSLQNIREKIVELLGSKCAVCGFNDPRALEIDHVNDNGNKERKIYSTYAYYKHILEEILSGSKDYQLLCANHNAIKRYEIQKRN
jgi:hypothetical protein